MATTPSSATRSPVRAAVQRLDDAATKAAARAEAAKQVVRSAKAALKKARKLSKAAKKTAKLARKKVDAARTAIRLAAAAKATRATGKSKARAKAVESTPSRTPADTARAVKSTPSKVPRKAKAPRQKSKSKIAVRPSVVSPPAKSAASPLLSAAEVAKSVIGRLAAAKRMKKKAVAVSTGDAASAGATQRAEDRGTDTVSPEVEAGEP